MSLVPPPFEVQRISFAEITRYWVEQNHFGDPQKVILEHVTHLGKHQSPYQNPRRISYGLFLERQTIGVTHLVQFNEKWVRYRTLNVLPQFRGQDLGWRLLCAAIQMDWPLPLTVFGWVRATHQRWALKKGFVAIEEDPTPFILAEGDQHRAFVRKFESAKDFL